MAKQQSATTTSGTVLPDVGVAEPEEELAKAQLAYRIQGIVRERGLTPTDAAALLGIDQPRMSALLNCRLANCSSGWLMQLLTVLGDDIEIVLRAKPRRRQRGRIRVVESHS